MSRANANPDAVRELSGLGLSIRAIAKRLGLPKPMVGRILATPIEPERATESNDELMERLAGMDVADSSALVPPFDCTGVDDGAVRWRDASGIVFGEMDLYRWGQRINAIIPRDYPSQDEYLTAWDAAGEEIEAANAHAWATVDAAGVVYDDARRRWVQQLRAV